MVRGKSINLYLMDGIASGRIKATMANWTGLVYKVPRTELDQCKDIEELKQSGVYFLFGTSDETGNGVVYIGQAGVRKIGEGILYRIQEHKNSIYKDYWTEVVVITTSNNSFGSTEISYLENRFCNIARTANRYEVKNANDPSPGHVTEEKQSELEDFIDYSKVVMGALGHKIFEPIVTPKVHPLLIESVRSDEVVFYIDYGALKATGSRTPEGFVVFLGSQISEKITPSCPDNIRRFREKYANKIQEGRITEDLLLSSPSAAASFVAGVSLNGNTSWKSKEGKTLKEVEKAENQ